MGVKALKYKNRSFTLILLLALSLLHISGFFMLVHKVPIEDINAEKIYSQVLSFFVGVLFDNGQCRRDEFLREWVKYGLWRKTLEKIWRRGHYKNEYISIAHTDFVSKATVHRWVSFADLTDDVIKKVRWVNWYKKLMTWLHAGSPKKFEKVKSDENYKRKNMSITNRGLARKGWLVNKWSASKRIHNAVRDFWGTITTRYTTHLWMTAQMSNLYSNIISYRFNRYSNQMRASQEEGVKTQKRYVMEKVWKREKCRSFLPTDWYIAFRHFFMEQMETI